MAKKTNGLKIVGIALLAIIGLGSISALVRNKDKDEDKHVHDFSQTNICADCGERQETILVSEVKEGMDLTGYSVRLTVSEEEFTDLVNSNISSLGGNIRLGSEARIDFSGFGFVFSFNLEKATPDHFNFISHSDSLYSVTGALIPEGYPVISEIALNDECAEIYSCIEFYYVGTQEATADPATYSMRREPTAPQTREPIQAATYITSGYNEKWE